MLLPILYIHRSNIDEIVRFPGVKPQKQPLTYAAKQLIAREVRISFLHCSEILPMIQVDTGVIKHVLLAVAQNRTVHDED